MPVTYVPEGRAGDPISRAFEHVSEWATQFKRQKLYEQSLDSELQSQAMQRELMAEQLKQAPDQARILANTAREGELRLDELLKMAPDRMMKSQAETQQAQANARTAGAQATIAENTANNIPFENVKADKLFEITMAAHKQELEKLKIDTKTADLRNQGEGPEQAAKLLLLQQQYVESQGKTKAAEETILTERKQRTMANVSTAAQLLAGVGNGSVSPADFQQLVKNSPDPDLAAMLKGMDPKAPLPKTTNEALAQIMGRMDEAMRTGGDPELIRINANLLGQITTDGKGVTTMKKDEFGRLVPTQDMDKAAEPFRQGFNALYGKKAKGSTTQPSAESSTKKVISDLSAPAKDALGALDRIAYHNSQNTKESKKAFSSNFRNDDAFDAYVDSIPFDESATPDKDSTGQFIVGAVRNLKQKKASEGSQGYKSSVAAPEILIKQIKNGKAISSVDDSDAKVFKQNVVMDQTAPASKHALYLGVVSQLAKARAADDDKLAGEILKGFGVKYGLDALTTPQWDSLEKLERHFGW